MLSVGLGPLSLPVSTALVLLGLVVALFAGGRLGKRNGHSPERFIYQGLWVGLLAARIAFVAMYYTHFQGEGWKVIDIRDGGFIVPIGVAAGLAWCAFQSYRYATVRKALLGGVAWGVAVWGFLFFAWQAMESGRQLPDLALRTADGQSVQLQDYRGKPIVINLWATWCPPCRREMPTLEAAQKANPDVTFLFANQGEDSATVEQFFQEQSLQLEGVLYDGGGRLGAHAGSRSLPTTLFYDAEGRQVNSHLGELSQASLTHALSTIKQDLNE